MCVWGGGGPGDTGRAVLLYEVTCSTLCASVDVLAGLHADYLTRIENDLMLYSQVQRHFRYRVCMCACVHVLWRHARSVRDEPLFSLPWALSLYLMTVCAAVCSFNPVSAFH